MFGLICFHRVSSLILTYQLILLQVSVIFNSAMLDNYLHSRYRPRNSSDCKSLLYRLHIDEPLIEDNANVLASFVK